MPDSTTKRVLTGSPLRSAPFDPTADPELANVHWYSGSTGGSTKKEWSPDGVNAVVPVAEFVGERDNPESTPRPSQHRSVILFMRVHRYHGPEEV
ncbi:hypothetical protein ACG7TL_002236 [Trametes sanguinea]